MKVAVLSCFHPFRGGISQFNAGILQGLEAAGHTVKAFNFTRQYPSLLFPGKTQYVTADDEAVRVESEAVLDTVNPFSWGRTARAIRAWKPDFLVMRYWMSWFAPSLGYVARRAGCPALAIVDNVIPHEPRFFDKPLTKYFLKGCDKFITLSEAVKGDLLALKPDADVTVLPHPLYSHFGEKLPREEAEKALGIAPGRKNLLFFGLIREYKGLDILLEAFRDLPEEYQLIVAGEPYGSFDRYRRIIDSLPGKDRVHLFLHYIKDSEVKRYFSAADVTVLPYRSATQSGISSVSYHFEVPMIVTDVGGLRDTIGDRGTGMLVAAPESGAVRDGILRYFADPSIRESCIGAIRAEKQRLSWQEFCQQMLAFQGTKPQCL